MPGPAEPANQLAHFIPELCVSGGEFRPRLLLRGFDPVWQDTAPDQRSGFVGVEPEPINFEVAQSYAEGASCRSVESDAGGRAPHHWPAPHRHRRPSRPPHTRRPLTNPAAEHPKLLRAAAAVAAAPTLSIVAYARLQSAQMSNDETGTVVSLAGSPHPTDAFHGSAEDKPRASASDTSAELPVLRSLAAAICRPCHPRRHGHSRGEDPRRGAQPPMVRRERSAEHLDELIHSSRRQSRHLDTADRQQGLMVTDHRKPLAPLRGLAKMPTTP